MQKYIFYSIILFSVLFRLEMYGEKRTTSFGLMDRIVTTQNASLGGHNISLPVSLQGPGLENPALLSFAESSELGLSFQQDAAKSRTLSASYVRGIGDRHTISALGAYCTYGSMLHTDVEGVSLGTFTPKDILFSGSYSYLLSSRWAGGASLMLSHTSLDRYRATAIGVNLGLNYYDEERDLSFSVAAKNVGAYITTFDDSSMPHLPFNLMLGLSKGVEHLPLRVHTTLVDLSRWSKSEYFRSDDSKAMSFSRLLLNHLCVGLEFLPIEGMHVNAGYNFRRGYEMKSVNGGNWNGLSLGAGMLLGRISIDASYEKCIVKKSSFRVSVSYHL